MKVLGTNCDACVVTEWELDCGTVRLSVAEKWLSA